MPNDTPITPAIAVFLAVTTLLAFVGVLVSLALGSIVAAGASGLVLIVVWFVLGFLKRRGQGRGQE